MATPTILVVSDSAADAALVKDILDGEFGKVFTSTDPDKTVEDFDRQRHRKTRIYYISPL